MAAEVSIKPGTIDNVKASDPPDIHVIGISSSGDVDYFYKNSVQQQSSVVTADRKGILYSEVSAEPSPTDGTQCLICGDQANGIHFRALSCAACNAFFRRSVAENRKYICRDSGDCEINSRVRCLCRACRLKKCLRVGMDPNAVQPQRDAIGAKPRKSMKIEPASLDCSPIDELLFSKTSSTRSVTSKIDELSSCGSDPNFDPPRSLEECNINAPTNENNLLHLGVRAYKRMDERRRLLFCPATLRDLLGGTEPIFKKEVYYLQTEQFRAEAGIIVEFLKSFTEFATLEIDDQIALTRSFASRLNIIEKYYLTYKKGGHHKNQIYHPNYTYIDLNDREYQGVDPEASTNSASLSKAITTQTVIDFNVPFFKKAFNDIVKPMEAMQMSEVELVGLMLVMLFDPATQGLSKRGREVIQNARNKLYSDWFSFYIVNDIANSPEKIGNVILITSAIKEFAILIPQNFHFIRVFGISNYNELLNDLFFPK